MLSVLALSLFINIEEPSNELEYIEAINEGISFFEALKFESSIELGKGFTLNLERQNLVSGDGEFALSIAKKLS